MPSKSKKQKKFMAAAAKNPKFAKKAGIKQSVAQEYHAADKRGYGAGGIANLLKKAKDKAKARLGEQIPLPTSEDKLGGTLTQIPPPGTTVKTPNPNPTAPNEMAQSNSIYDRAADRLTRLLRRRTGLAEGGKVGATTAAVRMLQKLAAKFEAALETEDHALAGRLSREMNQLQPGASKKVLEMINSGGDVEGLAKGGKVSGVLKLGKKMKEIPLKESDRAVKASNLSSHVYQLVETKGIDEARSYVDDLFDDGLIKPKVYEDLLSQLEAHNLQGLKQNSGD